MGFISETAANLAVYYQIMGQKIMQKGVTKRAMHDLYTCFWRFLFVFY